MRIISGKHRGRRIETIEGKTIRPTSSRAREAIFNILTHGSFGRDGESPLIGKRCVDIFCGTGALGLEALSRGASHVTFIDRNSSALSLARSNVERFGENDHAAFIRSDSVTLPPAPMPCTVAFADPPYDQNMGAKALISLRKNGWLEKNALVVLEVSEREVVAAPEGFEEMDERIYGKARILIFRNT